jgi:hypothetical protein
MGGSLSFNAASHGGVVPSGAVPGGDVAGCISKLLVGESRRWCGTRLRSRNTVQGPFRKLLGCGCNNFYFSVGPFVICKPPLNINAAI